MPETFPDQLRDRLRTALTRFPDATSVPDDFPVDVKPSKDPRFGDYQSPVAMTLAQRLGKNAREMAASLVEHLDVSGLAAPPEVAGNGFINFRLTPEAVGKALLQLASSPTLGVPTARSPRVIVIDFSAPNVAKPMHVGHIRSTIIGESLARIARFLGHRVITDNHIGDWGTQFGMIIHGWKVLLNRTALEQDPIKEFVRLYKAVNNRVRIEQFESALLALAKSRKKTAADAWFELEKELKDVGSFFASPENRSLARAMGKPGDTLETCREELVKLQQGDPENLGIWRQSVDLSLTALARIYARLGVTFDHVLGESFYNDALEPLVEELVAKGIARESQGAICIFSDGTLPPSEDPYRIQEDGAWKDNPAIVRKSDGGFLYATTDLATIDYRAREWRPDEVWYVVGHPQSLHFRQVFDAARRLGWSDSIRFTHVAFGSILGKDRKPFKTRSGENVGLVEVLEEAISRSRAFLDSRETGEESDTTLFTPEEKDAIAQAVGLGAVKYAELSQSRTTDYVFDWDKMLSLKGDTAPYLLYSYVRTRGIFRKLEKPFTPPRKITLTEAEEHALARKLFQFGEAVPAVLHEHKPNVLANYLYELAKAYHAFFHSCPVLKSEGTTRSSRLMLCEITSRVLRQGLQLLGIDVVERM
ncbi:MAG: arginine--tRNA ligase [Verrucomicrobia bacterium]|nr:arginine--tRNA ligase [Verrucomicrobiota bacterium]